MGDTVPWGPLGYVTFKRTYARRTNESREDSPKEEYAEALDKRWLPALNKQLKCGFTDDELAELRRIFVTLKGSMAGRFMWQLGTKTVDKLGIMSLQNCAFCVVDEPVRPFIWTMDALMLGSGVGYNIQREHVYQIPAVKKRKLRIERLDTKDADFIVPDTRQGWTDLIKRVLEAHFVTGEGFTFSTICIRGKGQPINGFGGTAAGPEDLCVGVREISKVLNNRAGKKLRPIDALDVMNIIGMIVVSGNVRRSAQIAIGDMDDLQFLDAKRWDLGNVPNWRAMSNNSVVCNDFAKLPPQFWDGYRGNGEPYGLINLQLARAIGRTGETQYPDPDVQGFNPCAEQPLANYETCCLAEIHLPNIDSEEELRSVATYLYRINKHSLLLRCHSPETEEVVHRNMRMGIGLTGIAMATPEQKSWLRATYEHLRGYDEEYSRRLGVPASIKLTTVKPGGTISLLSGVTPGANPGFAHHHIRRMRIASDTPLVEVCRRSGYKVEYERRYDGTENRNLCVVEFPCKFPPHTTVASQVTALDQLETVSGLQRDWSDNAVSCTVYYRDEELGGVRDWLEANYNENVKSVSFLRHKGHGYDQAPLEEITPEQYEALVAGTKPITSVEVDEQDIPEDQLGCAGGHCPIK